MPAAVANAFRGEKRKGYTFQRQSKRKPVDILGCPGECIQTNGYVAGTCRVAPEARGQGDNGDAGGNGCQHIWFMPVQGTYSSTQDIDIKAVAYSICL